MSDNQKKTYTIYFGGEMFDVKHLIGNAALAEAIYAFSEGRYIPVLPQNFKKKEANTHAIRDHALQALTSCDVCLFHYEGAEMPSDTLVQYLFAKFADIPTLLLHTNSKERSHGLMSSHFPRTKTVQMDGSSMYQEILQSLGGAPDHSLAQVLEEGRSLESSRLLLEKTAHLVIQSLDDLVKIAPILPKMLSEAVYQWLALMPGYAKSSSEMSMATLGYCQQKQTKGLL